MKALLITQEQPSLCKNDTALNFSWVELHRDQHNAKTRVHGSGTDWSADGSGHRHTRVQAYTTCLCFSPSGFQQPIDSRTDPAAVLPKCPVNHHQPRAPLPRSQPPGEKQALKSQSLAPNMCHQPVTTWHREAQHICCANLTETVRTCH